ncbi:MAG: DUF3052 domain-containing protein [Burkholderiaceae bacterium]
MGADLHGARQREGRLIKPARKIAGYSGTPLAQKLGIKEASRVVLVDAPAHYVSLLDPVPPRVKLRLRISPSTEIVHVFTTRRAELQQQLTRFRQRLRSDGVVWVSWPKKSSRVATDISEDTIREVALPLGFVDVKVCAIDEVWSGLKLVVRKEHR